MIKTFAFTLLFFIIGNTSGQILIEGNDDFIYSKHIRQEVNLSFKPFYTFRKANPINGTYHPVKLSIPVTPSYEISYGIIRNHFLTQVFFSSGKMRLFEMANNKGDTLGITYNGQSQALAFTKDSIKFFSFGLRLGRIGSLGKRFQYEASIAYKFDQFNKTWNQKGVFYPVFLFTDSNNVGHYTERLGINTTVKEKRWETFEFLFRIKMPLNSMISIQSFVSYCDNPIDLFNKNKRRYFNSQYWVYPKNDSQELIGHGETFTRMNQLHFGLGLSFVF